MKKKAIKLATSTAIAATAFVAAAPANQADAAVNVDQLVQDAQNAGTVLKWAISVEGSADGVTRPWAQYNNAKEAIAKAEAAVKGASFSDKLKYEARLTDPKIQVKRAQAYIDAITSSEKIKDLTANLNSAISSNDLDKVEAAYHKATAEYRKQTVLLDRVYGQSTRDQIRDAVKPALEKLVASVKNEVTVHMLANAANADVKASKFDDAAKKLTEAQSILDANVLKWETALQKSVTDVENAIPLKVISVSSDNKNTVTVKFSKAVPAVLPAGQFVFDNGLLVQSATVSADRKTVTLTTTTQKVSTTYALSYQGVATGLSFTTPASPQDSSVVIDAKDVARLETGNTRNYTVTLKNADGTAYTGAVNVDLYDALTKTKLTTAKSTITNVDGLNGPGAVSASTSAGLDGKVTFVVTGGAATNAVYPVVTKVEDGKTEQGGVTYFYLPQTTNAVVTGYEFGTNPFDYVSPTEEYVVANGIKWTHDSNDLYYIEGQLVTAAQFKTALNTKDKVNVDFKAAKSGVTVWNITSNANVPSSVSVTNPSKDVTYDGTNYRLTGKGQVGAEVYVFSSADNVYDHNSTSDVLVGKGTVGADGTWAVQASNLTVDSSNQLLVVQDYVGDTLALGDYDGETPATAPGNVVQTAKINVGKFAADAVAVTDKGATGLSISDEINFTFNNASFGHKFKEGVTGTIRVNDGYGKFATLSVKRLDDDSLVVTGLTSDAGFLNTSAGITIDSVSNSLVNQDELVFSVAASADKTL